MNSVSRRSFLRQSTAAGVSTLAAASALGANERIRLGFIGVANRGGQLIAATQPHADAEIVAVCDVDEARCYEWVDKLGKNTAIYNDHRQLLERPDIDAVVIATPDHWHAIHCVDACRAGKDVYVEKPLSLTVVEGRKMLDVARETGRVVQVGLHRRSSKLFMQLREELRNNVVGKVSIGRAYRLSNMYPNGIGKASPGAKPPTLDWNRWLGPQQNRPYQENIAPYKFRWWKAYSSQLGNWGVHYFDVIRWLLDEDAPESVSCHGGKFVIDDDRTIPDTLESIFEFKSGRLMLFGQYEASGHPMLQHGEFELRGTQGVIYAGGKDYRIFPERGGQFQDPAPRLEPRTVEDPAGNEDLSTAHMRNFLDCIKTRERPNADIEDGHKSTIFAHLANIALATRSRVEWDAENERILRPQEANALLHYAYRAPWSLDPE